MRRLACKTVGLLLLLFCFTKGFAKEQREKIIFLSPTFENTGGFFKQLTDGLAKELQEHHIDVEVMHCRTLVDHVRRNSKYLYGNNVKFLFMLDCDRADVINRIKRDKKVLVVWEPPMWSPGAYTELARKQFATIMTFRDDLVDNNQYFKIAYPNLKPMVDPVPFQQRKFCCSVSGDMRRNEKNELYTERRRAISFFNKYAPELFDHYGRRGCWRRYGYQVFKGEIPGYTGAKVEVIKNYKFSICYENTRDLPGYITEKILDCFKAGVIPIYLGADNITDYIPKDCFIDKRDFQTYQELLYFLKNMTEEEHNCYIERIREFLASDQAKVFTHEGLIQYFKKMVLTK